MVWLNIDAGELETEPEELWRLADIVNVACGGHAGDDASMRRVCAVARRVGAHPSYPDRAGFGRTTMAMPADALAASIEAQVAALAGIAKLETVKAHGALYHDANRDPTLARIVVEAAARYGAAVIGPAKGALHDAASSAGVTYLREAFADRGMRDDGTLIPRGEPGALVDDPVRAAGQAIGLACRGDVDTICVHGDTPRALEIARAVRDALKAADAVLEAMRG